ncbi:hypothetical protein [Robertmurraya sp.]|uniref:hypothetical protein n=1 Tax=Robertmurraya sp. TaxID=2837525 RepID=UPI00370459DB
MGVRKDNQEVVVANDYSCFAQMLEEYISYGAVQIVIPRSAPETKTLDQMPLVLKNRILIIDDSNEIETLNRLLFKLRKEFEVTIDEEQGFLKYPKNIPQDLRYAIDQGHSDLKKIALGFNHSVQADVHTENSIHNLRFLRAKTTNSETKIVLADLEALLNQYRKVDFDAITPPKNDTPSELISIFDKLINDKHYLNYSESINQLIIPEEREEALMKIRELSRLIRSKNYIGEGWDYVSKILKVWTGIPFPESKAIGSLFNNKELPAFVDMDKARARALEMWLNSDLTSLPLRRDGLPISNDDIAWLAPMDGMKVSASSNKHFSLGPVGELVKKLQEVQKQLK